MKDELRGVEVLLVEDDVDTGELLSLALQNRGAVCRHALTGAAAERELARGRVDVIVSDIDLPDGNACTWLARLRAVPGMADVPAIAVSGHAASADLAASLAAGFQKHMRKPARLLDIITAISILTKRSGPFALASTLARLAELTGCRYTSLMRFDRDRMVSVWTYDRRATETDAFPLDLPIEASYCVIVKQTGQLVAIENAAEDPRAVGHPQRSALAAYVAAPVFLPDGTIFGTLCSYDESPRTFGIEAKNMIAVTAREIEILVSIESPVIALAAPEDNRKLLERT